MSQNVAIVQKFFDRFAVSFEEMTAAFLDTFAEAGEFIAGTGIPATTGPEAAAQCLKGFQDGYGLATMQVDMERIGEADGAVWTERTDHLLDADGKEIIAIPVVGVFVIDEDGRIASWRDYWDIREFEKLASPS